MVPSPTYTLKRQLGNSLDMSMILVSLLRGAGYDAYVVYGYASKRTATRDESMVDYDLSNHPTPDTDLSSIKTEDAQQKDNRYRLKPARQLRSNYSAKMSEKQKKVNEQLNPKQEEQVVKVISWRTDYSKFNQCSKGKSN